RLDPLQVAALRVAHLPAVGGAPGPDAQYQLLEGGLDLPVHDRRPVVVVRGEHTARPQEPRRFREGRLRLHPVQRLRAGDEIRLAVGQAGRLRIRLNEAHVVRAGRRLGLRAHLGARLDADHLLGPIGPRPRRSLKWPFVSGAASAARARLLPHGPLDLVRQLAIWFGFLFAYRYTRGVADRDPFKAFQNGLRVADLEHRVTGLWELSLQSLVASSNVLREATSLTYWHSQFTVLGLVLLCVCLWRNEHFVQLRN